MLNRKWNEKSTVVYEEDVVMSCLDSFSDEDAFSIELADVLKTNRFTANLVGRKGKECLFFCIKNNAESLLTKFNKGDILKIRASTKGSLEKIIAFESVVKLLLKEPFKLLLVRFPIRLVEMNLRKDMRYKAHMPSTLFFSNLDQSIDCIINDISLSGCNATLRNNKLVFSPNQRVVLNIYTNNEFSIMFLEGVIVNKKLVGHEISLGIKFFEGSGDLNEYIQGKEQDNLSLIQVKSGIIEETDV